MAATFFGLRRWIYVTAPAFGDEHATADTTNGAPDCGSGRRQLDTFDICDETDRTAFADGFSGKFRANGVAEVTAEVLPA